MGRATRWLKGLFGIKNNKDNRRPSEDPKRPSITGLCYNDIETLRTNLSVAETDWKRSYCSEEEKHTMAVVAATAAATDAAVAAARAAVAVVRLTSSGGASLLIGRSRGESEAAVKIQTFFRGFLAKKALRALKGLVKLQALVRGHLVRKQAMLTLKNMQALMRAQSTARSRRSHRVIKNLIDHRLYKSAEKFGGAQGGEPGETVAAHTRRLSASSMPPRTGVESINGRRNSTSRRKSSPSLVDFTDYPCYKPESSPLPCHQFSGYISTPSHFNFLQELQYEEFRRCSSVQSTPRFSNTTESNDVFVVPSYMANTQSFRAKSRSSSAPKQRLSGGISRVSLHEMMFSRSSFSGVRMQRSCSKAQEAINLKNGISQKPPYE